MKDILYDLGAALAAVVVVIALLALASMLTGCAEMNAARAGVAKHGAQAMDQALEDAKWVTCYAASIGSLERELGGDPERIAGWVLYCGKRSQSSSLLRSQPQVEPQGLYYVPNASGRKEL